MHHSDLAIFEEQNLRLREENDLLRRALDETECGHNLVQQRDEFAKLIDLGRAIISELDINRVFTLVAKTARELIAAELLVVPILDAGRETYTYVAASGLGSEDMLNARFKIGVGMCGWVLRNKRPLLFGEPDEWWMDEKTRWEEGQQSALLVPLMGKKRIIGGLSGIGKAGGGSFSVHDLDVLSLFANQVSAAIENASLFRELGDKSETLELTNRKLEEEIEERQQIEASLRESEERYREIYNSPSDAILIHDAKSGAILDVNRAMLTMYGYGYDEARTLEIGTISAGEHPYTQEEAVKLVRLAAQNQPQTFEWLCKRKDGHLFWTEVALKRARIAGKAQVIASVRDITERREAAAALAAERERLSVTLRSIGDGVIATDTEKNIVVINKVAEELTGWSLPEAMGRPFHDVFRIINEQTRELCANPVDKVLASGRIIDLANHTVLIAKDGTEYSIADSGAPIRDDQSRIIGAVLVFRDVTEKNRTEKELLKLQKLESVGVLAGGIAHDFNNILAAILGNINLSLLDPGLTTETGKLLAEAEKASLRARDLAQQLLTLAKGGEPIRAAASLAEVVKDSADFVLRGVKVACRYTFPDDLWLVYIDKGQISQVVQNIVLNASHAMPNGGVVEVACENVTMADTPGMVLRKGTKYVKMTIKDNGTGIPADVIDNIFDPYFSTKKQGSGLGLAITHSIVRKHDGHIAVESTPGVGTTFTVYLPASEGVFAPGKEEKRAAPCARKAKILVMDDDEQVRNITQAMLNMMGHEVVFAKEGKEAVRIYQENMESGTPIDLSIMDLTVPGGMGGEEAVKKILRLDAQAKVVVSSGYSTGAVMSSFEKYGFCGALEKPFQMKDLAKIISTFFCEAENKNAT